MIVYNTYQLFLKTKPPPLSQTIDLRHDSKPEQNTEMPKRWVRCGKTVLYQQHKNIRKWLTDNHINFAQMLLKKQFRHCNFL